MATRALSRNRVTPHADTKRSTSKGKPMCEVKRDTNTRSAKGEGWWEQKETNKGTDPPLMGGINGIAKIFSAKSEESRRIPSMPVWRITGSIACYETNITPNDHFG